MEKPDATINLKEATTRQQRVQQICQRFDRAWKAGEAPRLDDFLRQTSEEERKELFGELLRIELARLAESGRPLHAEEYQARFPQYADCVASAVAFVLAPPTRATTSAAFERGIAA